jgi:DNA-binding transcriptional LysR family regulator
LLPPIIEQLRLSDPGINIDIVADNKPSDLSRREADIAIRNFRPVEEDLIARKIGNDLGYLYATPAYLGSIGNPSALNDFTKASFIGFADPDAIIEWLNNAGMSLTTKNFPITTESYLVHWEYVKQGLGIGIMPHAIGDIEPSVVRACEAIAPFEFPIWLVSHRELRTSRRVRIVFDLLADMLGS